MYTQTDVSRRRRRHWKRHAAAKRNEYERVRRDEPLFKETQKAVKKKLQRSMCLLSADEMRVRFSIGDNNSNTNAKKSQKSGN